MMIVKKIIEILIESEIKEINKHRIKINKSNSAEEIYFHLNQTLKIIERARSRYLSSIETTFDKKVHLSPNVFSGEQELFEFINFIEGLDDLFNRYDTTLRDLSKR